MAKYNITYSCGHTHTEQLFGPEKDRARRIAAAEKHGLCPACRAGQADVAIAATEAEFNLPELTGSEKQIAWARKIRETEYRATAEAGSRAITHTEAQQPEQVEQIAARITLALTWLAGQTSAKYWIETARYQGGQNLLTKAYNAAKQV